MRFADVFRDERSNRARRFTPAKVPLKHGSVGHAHADHRGLPSIAAAGR